MPCKYDIIDRISDQHLLFPYLVRSFSRQLYESGQRHNKESLKKIYRDATHVKFEELEMKALLDKNSGELFEQ